MSTISVLKACTGGYVGVGHVHPALLDAAREAVAEAKAAEVVHDGYVARCGDDLALVLLHDAEPGAAGIRALGHEAFARSGAVGQRLRQHAASTNGGPHLECVEIAFAPRPSEPVLCFIADKAGPGAWNVHLYRVFADPFNTPSLLTDPRKRLGFRFTVADRATDDRRVFDLPADLYELLEVAVDGERFVVTEVRSRADGEVAAVASAGSDPALLVRCHDGLPSVGEALEAFAFPYAVGGGGASPGPLMPVSTNDEACTRSDGPPRAIGLGFQVAGDRLVGPRDLLGDRAFDESRRQALVAADYLRRHGPFVPQAIRIAEADPLPRT